MSFLPSRNTTSIFLSTQSTSDPEVVNAILDTMSCASILTVLADRTERISGLDLRVGWGCSRCWSLL